MPEENSAGVHFEKVLQQIADDADENSAEFDNAEEENDDAMLASDEATMPSFGTPAWQEYVMRQFGDEELIGGAPTCDGCRRVLEQLVGPIIDSSISSYIGPCVENNGTATVVVGVKVLVSNETHPAFGKTIGIQEIADVNSSNTDAPYNRYPSATAATRAEGRALRKLLRLKHTFTAEEVSKVAEDEDAAPIWEPDDPITDSQIGVIDMLCGTGRLNMSVADFINSGKRTYANIRDVSNTTATRMIQELNKIQRQDKPRPASVSSYVEGWQS